MKIVNLRDIPAETSNSLKGNYGRVFQGLSLALGRSESSTDLNERQPFDVEISRIRAG